MVACGAFHTIAVTKAGRTFTFGCGGNGRLGHGDTAGRDEPVEIPLRRFKGDRIVFVAAG
jgi:regulator of chromosome condensation